MNRLNTHGLLLLTFLGAACGGPLEEDTPDHAAATGAHHPRLPHLTVVKFHDGREPDVTIQERVDDSTSTGANGLSTSASGLSVVTCPTIGTYKLWDLPLVNGFADPNADEICFDWSGTTTTQTAHLWNYCAIWDYDQFDRLYCAASWVWQVAAVEAAGSGTDAVAEFSYNPQYYVKPYKTTSCQEIDGRLEGSTYLSHPPANTTVVDASPFGDVNSGPGCPIGSPNCLGSCTRYYADTITMIPWN
jgi:hypothetical protein